MHVGSCRPGLGYRALADELIDYLTELAYTHVEFMPLSEHPFGGSWGYQVTSYYAPTSRFGHPDDLRYLIDRLHRSGRPVFLSDDGRIVGVCGPSEILAALARR